MKAILTITSLLLYFTTVVAQGHYGENSHQRPEMARQPEHTLTEINDDVLKSYEGKEYGKVLYRQAEFNMDGEGQAALVVYLHGTHGRGSDNLTQMRQRGIYHIGDYILSSGMKAIFVIPQCPLDYSWAGNRDTAPYVQNIVPLIKTIVKERDIDPSRIYLTGASAGGGGIWRLISMNKDMFASALVASGRARGVSANAFKDTPIYMTAGSDEQPPIDRIVEWAEELKTAGCNVRFDILDKLDHVEACVQAFTSERLEWVFSHRRCSDSHAKEK